MVPKDSLDTGLPPTSNCKKHGRFTQYSNIHCHPLLPFPHHSLNGTIFNIQCNLHERLGHSERRRNTLFKWLRVHHFTLPESQPAKEQHRPPSEWVRGRGRHRVQHGAQQPEYAVRPLHAKPNVGILNSYLETLLFLICYLAFLFFLEVGGQFLNNDIKSLRSKDVLLLSIYSSSVNLWSGPHQFLLDREGAARA